MTDIQDFLTLLKQKTEVHENIERSQMIQHSVENGEAFISKNGCLATWTCAESTGRSPKDTYIVDVPEISNTIDWNSPNNIKIDPSTFAMILEDAKEELKRKEKVYLTERVIGADSKYALPVTTLSTKALTSLFTDNMFRKVPSDIDKSIFFKKSFTLYVLPDDYLNADKYNGLLRKKEDGSTSDMAVIMDFYNMIGVVYGSAYMGSCKKMLFTVMNYLLPQNNILPLHCSANEGKDEKVTLFLGLSGTGKTTLSADPERSLLGDDEHGWSDTGIANFENGCYAKMINITEDKEPEIYKAVMHKDDYREHGAIIENAFMYPDGTFDFDDSRLTPNSRASYPLEFLKNIKKSSCASHPDTIIFLTADAYGVLPPISRLNPHQAMLWFLMGYTSKLAGTETGIVEPVATFSRFFGQPFMPANPDVYAEMLGENMKKYNTEVYLINTGWSGGEFGVGKRIDLKLTRKMVQNAIKGSLKEVDYKYDPLFHVNIPVECDGVPSEILFPENTWADKEKYKQKANSLAKEFSEHFDKVYGSKNILPEVKASCPGK